jgi:hypothetical protein
VDLETQLRQAVPVAAAVRVSIACLFLLLHLGRLTLATLVSVALPLVQLRPSRREAFRCRLVAAVRVTTLPLLLVWRVWRRRRELLRHCATDLLVARMVSASTTRSALVLAVALVRRRLLLAPTSPVRRVVTRQL